MPRDQAMMWSVFIGQLEDVCHLKGQMYLLGISVFYNTSAS